MSSDWRFKITCPAIINDSMEPVKKTGGVIFPYTPVVRVQYTANYSDFVPTHSNHRGLFYTNSGVENLMVEGTFTCQDSSEADYIRATKQFFITATKGFYGASSNKGSPPPMVFLYGFGEMQFNKHPALLSLFNYSSPSDVDYIPTTDKRDMIPTKVRLSLTLLPVNSRKKITDSSTKAYHQGYNLKEGYW